MITRQIVTYLLAVPFCTAFATASYCIWSNESKELTKLISQSGDGHMTPNDQPFFLAAHNFDATPKDGYVPAKVDGTIYKGASMG